MIAIIFLVVLMAVVCAGILAGNKNRNAAGWVFGTLLFTPSILILMCLEKLEPVEVEMTGQNKWHGRQMATPNEDNPEDHRDNPWA